MGYRVDEIDKRILYELVADARRTSAPMIAESVDVTPATIRHRIDQLEEHGIIQGYHAAIDYERVNGRITTQYICTASVSDRPQVMHEVLQVSGVVKVRELLAGRENLLVTAVGTDTQDMSRIARELSDLGLDLVREDIVKAEITGPYEPFVPDSTHPQMRVADFQSLSGGAEVVEFTVPEDAPITGQTLEAANESGLIDDEILVVSLERGETMLTPKGDTTIEAGDVLSLFAPDSIPEQTMRAFQPDADDIAE